MESHSADAAAPMLQSVELPDTDISTALLAGAHLEAPAEGLQRGCKVQRLAVRTRDQDGIDNRDAEGAGEGSQHERCYGLRCCLHP